MKRPSFSVKQGWSCQDITHAQPSIVHLTLRKNTVTVQKWPLRTHAFTYVPSSHLHICTSSTASYLPRIVSLTPPSSHCCPRPHSRHPSNLPWSTAFPPSTYFMLTVGNLLGMCWVLAPVLQKLILSSVLVPWQAKQLSSNCAAGHIQSYINVLIHLSVHAVRVTLLAKKSSK